MFKMYYGKLYRGLCSTKEVGVQREGERNPITFVEDCESYDYFTVHDCVEGFGNDDLVRFSAKTIEECEEFLRLHDNDLGIIGQKFGQEFKILWK